MALSGDGFRSHKMTLKAQQLLHRARIKFIIGEGDTSQVCQPFDREAARSGKGCMRDAVDITTSHRVWGTHMDQWDLVHVAIYGYLYLMRRPKIIRSPFKSTNMLMSERVDFTLWLEKIKDFIVSGAKYIGEGEVTPRSLLPGWYANIDPEVKSKAAGIVKGSGGWSDTEMLVELAAELSIPVQKIPEYQTCYFVETSTDPGGVGRDIAPAPRRVGPELDVNAGLTSFELKPRGLKGPELFEHMSRFSARNEARRTTPLLLKGLGSPHLDLAVGSRVEIGSGGRHRIVSDQVRLIKPSQQDLTEGAILRDVGAKTASIKVPKRMLNRLGEVNHMCVLANSEGRIERLKAVAELAASIDKAQVMKKHRSDAKRADDEEEIRGKESKGIAKLIASGGTCLEAAHLTVPEMRGVALVHLGVDLKKGAKALVQNAFKAAVREKANWEPRGAGDVGL